MKKSIAAIAPQCARKNALHDVRLLRSRARVHAGFDQDALDRVAANLMAKVGERAADAGVAPARIFLCHAEHELDDVGAPLSAAVTSSAAVVPACDQAPIPAQLVSAVTKVSSCRSALRPSFFAAPPRRRH
jgi:hypothetical protein